MIGEKVEVTILEVKGTSVRIGIEAPSDVPIYRKELYLDIIGANKQAVLVDRKRLENVLTGILKTAERKREKAGKKGDDKNGQMD